MSPSEPTLNHMAEAYGIDDEDILDVFPLTYANIAKEQSTDKNLIQLTAKSKDYKLTAFHGGGSTKELITYKGKIVIPKTIQKRCVKWYHEMLCHPGETRTEQTLRQHYYWQTLREDVAEVCQKCDTCQRSKKKTIKYGHLPVKTAEAEPWETLCVDLIGPYTLKRKGKKNLILHCLTMIDPATGWFEMAEVKDKSAFEVAEKAEIIWLTRYPWPTQIVLDRGREFMGEFVKLIQTQYGIKRKAITARNPQANAIIERVHQTIGNIIRKSQIQTNDGLNEEDPWTGVLAATMFAIRATYHTTLQATPSQLVFGRDAILNVRHEADWNFIRARKQRLINKNNEKENAKRKEYEYQIGQKVLVAQANHTKFGQDPYEGPYIVTKVNDNGTVRLKQERPKGATYQTLNIRNVFPYKD
jgi:hypothetical protein